MHWYDEYIDNYRANCSNCVFSMDDRNSDCLSCDEFLEYLSNDIGSHNEVWPYDFNSEEQYVKACAWANEADGIVSDEELHWWSGDSGYVQGISSPAIDPRDFASKEEYEDSVCRYLFGEAVFRHPIIPSTSFWFHAYVKFLKETESVFCADKSILALLDELNNRDSDAYAYAYDQLAVPTDDEIEREIRYSSWRKPRLSHRRSGRYSDCYYSSYYSSKQHVQRYRKKYTEKQFRNDLLYHHPELLSIVNGVIHRRLVDRRSKLSQMEEYIEEYLPDVLMTAFYIHDMFGFSVEDCVQNGLEGLLRGLKNGLWDQNTPRWMWRFDSEVRREQYVLWEMRLYMIQYSQEFADYIGFTMNRRAAKVVEAIMFERKDLSDLSPDDFSSDYRDQEESKFLAAQIKKFFCEKNPIGLIPPQADDEAYSDCDAGICRAATVDLLRELVSQLPDRERNCLILRYGLETGRPMTFEEIADAQYVSRERVRQIEKKAIDLIKKLPGYADLCELTENIVPIGAEYLVSKRNSFNYHRIAGTENHTILDAAIDVLNLSPRATNSLKRVGCTTVQDALDLDKITIVSIRSCGQKTILEIAQKMTNIGYINSSWNYHQWKQYYKDCEDYPDLAMSWLKQGVYDTQFHGGDRKKLADCDIGGYLSDILMRHGVVYIDQLMFLSYEQLRGLPAVDLQNWHEAIMKLQKLGIEITDSMRLFMRPYRPPTELTIRYCGFTSEFKNVMRRAGIYRLDTLQNQTVETLKKYRSVSSEDWNEVDRQIRILGVMPSEAIMELAGTTYDTKIVDTDCCFPEIKGEIASLTIDELDLSLRTFNCLKRAGINTVSDIVRRGTTYLKKVCDLPTRSYKEMVEKLSAIGISIP